MWKLLVNLLGLTSPESSLDRRAAMRDQMLKETEDYLNRRLAPRRTEWPGRHAVQERGRRGGDDRE